MAATMPQFGFLNSVLVNLCHFCGIFQIFLWHATSFQMWQKTHILLRMWHFKSDFLWHLWTATKKYEQNHILLRLWQFKKYLFVALWTYLIKENVYQKDIFEN